MPPITAPLTHPAASDGPDDKPRTASIAAAATSIDFMIISLGIAHRPGQPDFRSLRPATAWSVSARLLANSGPLANGPRETEIKPLGDRDDKTLSRPRTRELIPRRRNQTRHDRYLRSR